MFKMFIYFLFFFTSIPTLSNAVPLCVSGDPVLQVPAGVSEFHVLLPPSAQACSATVRFNPYALSNPIHYRFKTVDCAGDRQTAHIEVPKYVPNGQALLTWECKNMSPCGIPLYISEGLEDASEGRELEGVVSCVPDRFVREAPSWSVLMDEYEEPSSKIDPTAKISFINTTAAFNLDGTVSRAMWLTGSVLPVITHSSGNNFPTPLGNITPAAQAPTPEPHHTSISIHPSISQAKPPGKPTSDPSLSSGSCSYVLPLAFAVALASTIIVVNA
ncbi:hypothetical protein HDV57DRAFT_488124 [Trichoderma longibrachiatum]